MTEFIFHLCLCSGKKKKKNDKITTLFLVYVFFFLFFSISGKSSISVPRPFALWTSPGKRKYSI